MNQLKEFFVNSAFLQFSWLNPLVLGIVPAIIVLLLKPLEFDRYTSEHNADRMLNNYINLYAYIDFENDNKKEKIRLGDDITGKCGLYLYDENDNLTGQFNLKYGLAKARLIKNTYTITLHYTSNYTILTKNSILSNQLNSMIEGVL